MSYRRQRTTEETLTDNVLALCMLYLSREHGFEGSRLKAMKMLFLAAYPMFRDRTRALNMRFYRYRLGPYSVHAQRAWGALAAVGLLREPSLRGGRFRLTDEGAQLAKEFYEEVLCSSENSRIRRCFVDVAQRYGDRNHNDILEEVYEMRAETLEKPGESRRIRDVQEGETFTRVLEPTEAVNTLGIPEGWLTTLAIELDRSHRAGLARAMADLAAGRVVTLP